MNISPSVTLRWFRVLLPTALSFALITGCGDGAEDLPPPPTTPDVSTGTDSDALASLDKADTSTDKLDEIIQTLNDLKAKIDALENGGGSVTSTGGTTDKPTTSSSSKPTTGSSAKPTTTSSAAPAAPQKDANEELGKLMRYVSKAPAIDAIVVQSEKQLGEVNKLPTNCKCMPANLGLFILKYWRLPRTLLERNCCMNLSREPKSVSGQVRGLPLSSPLNWIKPMIGSVLTMAS